MKENRMSDQTLTRNWCCKIIHIKFAFWIFLGSSLVVWSICTLLKGQVYMDALPILNLQLSKSMNITELPVIGMEGVQRVTLQTGVQRVTLQEGFNQPEKLEPELKPICNFAGQKSDFCDIIGDIRIQGKSFSIFFTSPQLAKKPGNSTFSINLYARKNDRKAMGRAKELSLRPASSDQAMPKCTVNHTAPAIVFSAGGYTGNIFHDFSDVMIPLFLTSKKFNGEVQFLLQHKKSWWVNRHEPMLKALSKYDLIDFDHDKEIRCFENATIGLMAHKDFGIEPEMPPYGHTLRNFTQFARRAYGLTRDTAIKIRPEDSRKPKLLLIDRKKTRALLNIDEIAAEAGTIGFEVQVVDARYSLQDFSTIVNSCDVMIGVHGAGLTNMIFLPENAVLIQVVPLGLNNISYIFYQRPAKKMNIRYLEYKVSVDESTLVDQYPKDHLVFRDPDAIHNEGYGKFKSIYMDRQDVRLDVSKFRTILLRALQLLYQ